MRILLDECMPFPLVARLADLRHAIEHAGRCGLAGLANGAVFDHAVTGFDLFITNDRHFRNPRRFPSCPTMGTVFVRIAPCVTDLVAPCLRRLLTDLPEDAFAGRRIMLHRDSWQFMA